MGRTTKIAIGTVCIGSLGAGWWWRPLSDPKNDNYLGPQRTEWMSRIPLSDNADVEPPLFFRIGKILATFTTVSLGRIFANAAGSFRIVNDHNYLEFLRAVTNRDEKPLLTVSNHRCLADDATIFSSILPFFMNIQPKFLRYSLCAQEYCFNPNVSSLLSAYIGLGQVLPIWRGGGINQKLLYDFSHYVAAGKWCHMFPEAGIWQLDTLGGRSNGKEKEIGKLKWGIAKLIAHSPSKPIVIPFFFSGTETIIPQDPDTKEVASYVPKLGHNVVVRFGTQIDFDDLIEEHEKVHGKLWKYSASTRQDEVNFLVVNPTQSKVSFHQYWDSKPSDLDLYSKITRRIEERLNVLNIESNIERELEK